jgi:hypothetical protein
MANALYDSAKAAFLGADIDLLVDDIRVILVDLADYTFSAAHDQLADVPSAARVAVSGALGTKTTTAGTFDAADVTISGVTGDVSEAIIVYKHTGTESAPLIAFIDTAQDGSTALSFTPNGSDLTVSFDAAGIFSI